MVIDILQRTCSVPDKKRTILIVDDDEDDCLFLKESLDDLAMNYEVQYVLNADGALDFLKGAVILPSLIILDLNMPRMNGIELLRVMAGVYTIPVVLYTTTCTDDVIMEAKKLDAIACFKKGSSYAESQEFAKKVFGLMKERNE